MELLFVVVAFVLGLMMGVVLAIEGPEEKDAAFAAGYFAAMAYAQEPQPGCGHATANRATFMLQPSGELVEYCSACPPKNGNTDRQLETVAAGAPCQSDNELWGV